MSKKDTEKLLKDMRALLESGGVPEDTVAAMKAAITGLTPKKKKPAKATTEKKEKPAKSATEKKEKPVCDQEPDTADYRLIKNTIEKMDTGALREFTGCVSHYGEADFIVYAKVPRSNMFVHLKFKLDRKRASKRSQKNPGSIRLYVTDNNHLWDSEKCNAICPATDYLHNKMTAIARASADRERNAEKEKERIAKEKLVGEIKHQRTLVCEAFGFDMSLADVDEDPKQDKLKQLELTRLLLLSGRIDWKNIRLDDLTSWELFESSFCITKDRPNGVPAGVGFLARSYGYKDATLTVTAGSFHPPYESCSWIEKPCVSTIRLDASKEISDAFALIVERRKAYREAKRQAEIRAAEERRKEQEAERKAAVKDVLNFLAEI